MQAVELLVVPVRDGIQVPGTTTRMVVTGLIWRTYGSARPRRAQSVLDWAGLLGHPARAVRHIATRHGVTVPTIRNRVQHVRSRGQAIPLSPLVLRDTERVSYQGEDHLSRQRCAYLLGVRPPSEVATTDTSSRLNGFREARRTGMLDVRTPLR